MKKNTLLRVRALLCPFFGYARRKLGPGSACGGHDLPPSDAELLEALHHFFRSNPPEMVRYFTLLIFQCWALNDCKLKAEVTDTGLADFLDQLNELVASAHLYYARRRAEVVVAA